ncbi:MAG: hypothetical protein ACREXT_18640 [Gammaproteobacteria bacterium]
MSCVVKWRHHYRRDKHAPLPVNRAVAYYAGRLFRGTDDGRVIESVIFRYAAFVTELMVKRGTALNDH